MKRSHVLIALVVLLAVLACLLVVWSPQDTPTPPQAVAPPSDPELASARSDSSDDSKGAAPAVTPLERTVEFVDAQPQRTVPLGPNGTLRVHVLLPDRSGIAADTGVRVLLPEHASTHAFALDAQTDAEGFAMFEHVPQGSVLVRGALSGEVGGAVLNERTTTLEVVLASGITLRGRVQSAGGQAAAYAELRLLARNGDRDGPLIAKTDTQGRFDVNHVLRGSRIAVRGWEVGASCIVEVDARAQGIVEIDVRLPDRATRIVGQVLDENEMPLVGAAVCAEALHGSAADPTKPWAVTRTDDEGRFELRGVPQQATRLIALRRGLAPCEEVFELGGRERFEVILRMQRGVTVRGRAHSSDNGPAAGIDIAYVGASTFTRIATRTAADGSYVLSGVLKGRAKLVFGAAQRDIEVPENGLSRCDLLVRR